MIVRQIAKVCHEANRAYCKSIGDDSQVPWEEAPEWQKESAVNGVVFHLENPDVTPEQSHENWMKEKIADGWKYGHKKDEESKFHPCLIEYENLPRDQQTKDYIFKAIVEAMK